MTDHASSQLALFHLPTEKTSGEMYHERMIAKAISPEVIDDLLAVFRSHRGKYIEFHQKCYEVWQRHNLGSYINDALHHMLRRGLIEPKRIYHGTEIPVGATPVSKKTRGKQANLEKPYMGYYELYRIKESG